MGAMMREKLSDLACRLVGHAESICRHYLSNGRRVGRYWIVGDVHNTPGRSLYVRLRGPCSGAGAAGKWADVATGQHGDLLDLIAAAKGASGIAEVLDEARHFLGLPESRPSSPGFVPTRPPEAARRLFAMARPIAGTLAEHYLHARGLAITGEMKALRFHPRCFYRAESDHLDSTFESGPALIAAVTDLQGAIAGVQRTWLDPSGRCKAAVETPRRAMGHLLGHAARFGSAEDVLAAGEGIETVLSLRSAAPLVPLAAAFSAGNLAALLLPPGLRRVYVARDRDPAGQWAAEQLAARAAAAGIEAVVLTPVLGDFNDDLRQFGPGALASALRGQLAPEDVDRFCRAPERGGRLE